MAGFGTIDSRFSVSSISQFYSSGSDIDDDDEDDDYSPMHLGATESRYTAEREDAPKPSATEETQAVYTPSKAESVASDLSSPVGVSQSAAGTHAENPAGPGSTPPYREEYTSPVVSESDAESVRSSVAGFGSRAAASVGSAAGEDRAPERLGEEEEERASVRSSLSEASRRASVEGIRPPSAFRESGGTSSRGSEVQGSVHGSAASSGDEVEKATHDESEPERNAAHSEHSRDGSSAEKHVATLSSLKREVVDEFIQQNPSYNVFEDKSVFPASTLNQTNEVSAGSVKSGHLASVSSRSDIPSVRSRTSYPRGSASSLAGEREVPGVARGAADTADGLDVVSGVEHSTAISVNGEYDLPGAVTTVMESQYRGPSDGFGAHEIPRNAQMDIEYESDSASGEESPLRGSSEAEIMEEVERERQVDTSLAPSDAEHGSSSPPSPPQNLRYAADIKRAHKMEERVQASDGEAERSPAVSPVSDRASTPNSPNSPNFFIDIGDHYRDSVDNPNLLSADATPMNAGEAFSPQQTAEDNNGTGYVSPSYQSAGRHVVHSGTLDDAAAGRAGHRSSAATVVVVESAVGSNPMLGSATAQHPQDEHHLAKALSNEVAYYKQLYAQLESKVTEIWNQREAFRVAGDRMAENIVRHSGVKAVRFEGQTNVESDEDIANSSRDIYVVGSASARTPVSQQRPLRSNSSVHAREVLDPSGASLDCFSLSPRGIRCDRGTMERLLNCGAKLYAFKLSTPGVRSKDPLFIDVCPLSSAYSGKIVLSNDVGLFKVSLTKPSAESQGSMSYLMMNYLGLRPEQCSSGYLYGLLNSFADYVGLPWSTGTDAEDSQSHRAGSGSATARKPQSDDSPPHVHIKYMHSLVTTAQGLIIPEDSFPSNCNIGSMFHGRHEHLFCVEQTRGLKKSDLQDNGNFTFILDTSPSTSSRRSGARRFNSHVHIVHSVTHEYLCVDLLTRELRFAGGQCSRAYSKYVVPASFKMVPLYNVLIDRAAGEQEKVVEAAASARYRRCVTERATSRHSYDMPRVSRHMVDEYGNFAPHTQAAGTPAPSPSNSTPSSSEDPTPKGCVLHATYPGNMKERAADTYDIRDSGERASDARNVEAMYSLLGTTDHLPSRQDQSSALPPRRGPVVKDLRMKFERLSSRNQV
ncbi:hypothetical protein, conserved [Babesia bigemina]|uniref:Uncharacterized protein n=1 Tax=Babesia bigemina TaxID=5866 RepID=A0A061D7W9_BABBI|nr:hypothetical protein, conserved [Babesia bigemina]CDR95014.1 hypothetical protein, conserved [Babesia bigemina]|eukprot:XP_012767200.1 hypothetical protein, conserved [Babesia bigemina]